MTYEEATAVLNQDRNATYHAKVNGHFVTLSGNVMKGFILPGDNIEMMRRLG